MDRLGFIGTGNMGSAIIKGVVNSNLQVEIYAYDTDQGKIRELKKYGVIPCENENELVQSCDYILLAVKPQIISGVLEKIAPDIDDSKTIISIAAGISSDYIREKTYPAAKVIQVMPNTPMMLGEGASAIARTNGVYDSLFNFARSVIESCGIAVEVPVSKMNEIIAINGSSPAFIYLFAKGFVEYAKSVGISADGALKLFSQSLIGSAKMLTESNMTVDELIEQVSSPGGTTIAGLEQLNNGGLIDIVDKCCKACTNRAYELAKK